MVLEEGNRLPKPDFMKASLSQGHKLPCEEYKQGHWTHHTAGQVLHHYTGAVRSEGHERRYGNDIQGFAKRDSNAGERVAGEPGKCCTLGQDTFF